MKNKRKGSADIVLLVILIILVCAVGGYLVWNNMYKDGNVATTNQSDSNKNESNEVTNNVIETNTTSNTETSTRKALQLSDNDLVQKLYAYIPNQGGLEVNSAYSSKLMTINDLKKDLIFVHVFRAIGEIPYNQREAFINSDGTTTEYKGNDYNWFSFDASILTSKMKEMYNTVFEISEKEHYHVGSTYLNYINGKFSFSSGGGGASFEYDFCKLLEAYEENDNLYIVDKKISFYIDHSEKKCIIYNNWYDKNILKELDANACAQIEGVASIKDYLFSNYNEYSSKYIHTFKKNENGQYYWYSTEPLK